MCRPCARGKRALAPGAQEVALAVEHDHRVLAAVEHVDAVLAVHRDRGDVLELPALGQLRPVLHHAVAVLAAAQDRRHRMSPFDRPMECVRERSMAPSTGRGRESGMRVQALFKAGVVVALASLVAGASLADIDRAAVDFTTPADIKWVQERGGHQRAGHAVRRPDQAGPVRRAHQVAARQHEPAALPSERPLLRGDLRHLVDGHGREVRPGQHRAGAGGQLRHPLRGQGALRRRQGRGGPSSRSGAWARRPRCRPRSASSVLQVASRPPRNPVPDVILPGRARLQIRSSD